MTLPFDTHQFLAAFAAYNAAIWPAQVAAYALGFVMLGALFLRYPLRERVILAGLAAMWAWNGLVYHLAFFAPMNPAAYGFAALFALYRLPLERIRAPTLIISVRDDLFNTLRAAEFAAAAIPNAKLVVFDRGGHLLVGHDREVRAIVGDFLAKASAAPTSQRPLRHGD